jgi:hypothetical protein
MTEAVLLHAEDRQRMARLYEEVLIRLEEMAMITARNLGLNSGSASEVRFSPVCAAVSGEGSAVELVRDVFASACYDYSRGVCFQHDPSRTISDLAAPE